MADIPLGENVSVETGGRDGVNVKYEEGPITVTKTIAAGNKGDAKIKFREMFNIVPGVDIHVQATKREGRGGSAYFKVTAKFNKGGSVKKYAKGGGIRKVRYV